jgi:hypothetical protein
MSDHVIDFCACKEAREREVEAHDALVDDMLMRHAMLAQALQQMQEFSEDEEVLRTLRFAVTVFEGCGR